VGTAAFLILYQWLVEPAGPGSMPVRVFTWAAQVRAAAAAASACLHPCTSPPLRLPPHPLPLPLLTHTHSPRPPTHPPLLTHPCSLQGPLRGAMLSFYAGASDFTRRLVSPKANSKFCSPDAGPEDEGSGKEEDLAAVVRAVKERCAGGGCWGRGGGGWGWGGWGCGLRG
jgi:hypothetical protein